MTDDTRLTDENWEHYSFGHRADDPPVPDLDQWTNEGSDDEPLVWGNDRYTYYFCGRRWMCANWETETVSERTFLTVEETLADLRQFHAEQIEKAARLELFHAFAKNLNDVDEPDEDWKNRLGWAWQRLLEYAQRLGRDYERVVEQYYVP